MPRPKRSMLWPDLAAVHATYFAIGLEMELNELSELLSELGLSEDTGTERFVEHYTKSEKRHEAYGHFHRSDHGDRICHLSFDLDPRSYPKGTRQFSEVYEALLKRQLLVLGHCSANFDYAIDAVRPIIPLPWRLVDYEASPFDEVRGARLVKLDSEGQTQYSVIMDMRGLDNIYLNIDFDYAAPFDANYLLLCFTKALDLSSRLVRPLGGRT